MALPSMEERYEHRIKALEDSNKKRRWYSETSNIITAIAVLVSLATLIWMYTSKSADDVRLKREELAREREELRKLVYAIYTLQDHFEKTGYVVDQQILPIYIDAAESLVKKFPEKVSHHEYLALAHEMYVYGYYGKAKDYYKMARESASGNSYAENIAYRATGSYYYYMNDIRQGREYYQQSLNSLINVSEEYTKFTLGFTYKLWAYEEFNHNFLEE